MLWKTVQKKSDFPSSLRRCGPLVELINQVHTFRMEDTFLSKIRDCQCVQEGRMLQGAAEPEGFGLVLCGKKATFKVRNRWRTTCSWRGVVYVQFVLDKELIFLLTLRYQ